MPRRVIPALAALAAVSLATPAQAAGVNLGMELWFLSQDFVGLGALAKEYPVGWTRIHFLPMAQANEHLSFRGRFALDNFGLNSQGLGTGHFRTSTLDTGSPFYVDWAYMTYHDDLDSLHLGIFNLSREIKLGTAIANPFDYAPVWSLGFSRFGAVGTPPLTARNGLDASALNVHWLQGTNVALETLDPNSTFVNFPSPSLAAVWERDLGPARFALATSNGAWGVDVARAHDPSQGLWGLPRNYPTPAALNDGYSLAMLESSQGSLRVQAALRADNNTMGTSVGKSSSLTVDLGDETLAASFNLAGENLPLDRAGAYVWDGNVLGFGLGAGVKAVGVGGLRGTAPGFLSYGPMLKTPEWGWLPSFDLAVQQTNGPSGEALAAGYTVETRWKPSPYFPTLGLEYSAGKFDPTRPNLALDPTSAVTHQLVAVSSVVRF